MKKAQHYWETAKIPVRQGNFKKSEAVSDNFKSSINSGFNPGHGNTDGNHVSSLFKSISRKVLPSSAVVLLVRRRLKRR